MIRKCFCRAKEYGQSAKFQDERYGKQNRVFNQMKDPKSYRCTICGRVETKN